MGPWLWLLLAGLFEIGFTTCMKLSDGFTRWPWIIAFAVCALASFGLLNKAMTCVPLGTAYAVWTGIGAAGTAIVGIALFRESFSPLRVMFIITLIASIIGLKFVAGGPTAPESAVAP